MTIESETILSPLPGEPTTLTPPSSGRQIPSAIRRYGLAVISVAIALGLALFLARDNFQGVEFPLFLMAIAVTVWYVGVGPAIVAIVLSSLAFDYFFTPPLHTFYVTRGEIPYYVMFVLFSLLLTWFSAIRRRVEAELLQSRDELKATNKELEAFAYSTSHDLRAPLRHVAGYAELLQKSAGSTLDEKSKRYVATIRESARRMGTLIDDLLAFSRIGRAEARETTVSMDQLVREVQKEVAPETNGRTIDWKIGKLPDLRGDRSMLKIAVVNLVSNAVKFTRTRPRAEIEVGCAPKQRDCVVVFIRDNGVGFDMKYVNKLFGVFQRLHRTEEFEGTGIGLATVQRVIHRHGGRVWADSVVDKGSTFYISLPNP